MNIHEYQAKSLFKSYGLKILNTSNNYISDTNVSDSSGFEGSLNAISNSQSGDFFLEFLKGSASHPSRGLAERITSCRSAPLLHKIRRFWTIFGRRLGNCVDNLGTCLEHL